MLERTPRRAITCLRDDDGDLRFVAAVVGPLDLAPSASQLAQRLVERAAGRGREHELAMRAMDLARGREIAAVEAADRRDAECRRLRRLGGALGQVIEQIERAPALAVAGAHADGDGRIGRQPQLGRERERGEVVARGSAAILGELDQPRQRDLLTLGDILELEPHRREPAGWNIFMGRRAGRELGHGVAILRRCSGATTSGRMGGHDTAIGP